jgi:hypothetical protein
MDANKLLEQMLIPEPCSMDWDQMRGDDRSRHCEACGKRVYDLTAMKPSEAVALLSSRQPEICGVAYKKPNGTLFLFDNDPAPEPAPARWQFRIRSLMAVIAGVAAALGVARAVTVSDPPAQPKKPTPATVSRVMGALRWNGPVPGRFSQSDACQ